MSDLHPTVRLTDELRAAAEQLRDLGHSQIAHSDDPLTVFRNLYATFDALVEAWPALADAAGFRDFFDEEDLGFVGDIEGGLKSAAAGLARAQDSI
ncbi:hypothetical protein MQE23_08625 [Streptomyces sp. HP-A2021]|uniref:hypothetical protein n=1 Tax=Streptomyces sp. HP-A2021 TaxID=2927875 RepID=UPI001FAEFD16|nr:hypothetical protein [Streptomyces sp. HP-A2021]UOB09116.1 hypothetical protein MQE23_08625 [Streptomyces sp. HP-A2021]